VVLNAIDAPTTGWPLVPESCAVITAVPFTETDCADEDSVRAEPEGAVED
jgi:hypothetical protein